MVGMKKRVKKNMGGGMKKRAKAMGGGSMKKRSKLKKGTTPFGMLSVNAGVDNNSKPTQADRIAGATKGKSSRVKAMGGGSMKKRVKAMGGGAMKKRAKAMGGGMMKKRMKRGGKVGK